MMAQSQQIADKCGTVEENDDEELAAAFDNVSGAELGPKKVYEARMEDVKFIRDMKFYDKVPVSECWEKIGKGPITTKWIDINKGGEARPKYRCVSHCFSIPLRAYSFFMPSIFLFYSCSMPSPPLGQHARPSLRARLDVWRNLWCPGWLVFYFCHCPSAPFLCRRLCLCPTQAFCSRWRSGFLHYRCDRLSLLVLWLPPPPFLSWLSCAPCFFGSR